MLRSVRWALVGVLSMTVTVSYGVLMYAFPVMLAPMQEELGWSSALLTGGFSVAALATGIAAIPVGRWIDRYGPRTVMTTGSVAAALLLIAWSRVQHPVTYILVWAGLGAPPPVGEGDAMAPGGERAGGGQTAQTASNDAGDFLVAAHA